MAYSGAVLLSSLVMAGSVVLMRQLGAFEGVELRAYDLLLRLRPDAAIDDRVLVVGITEQDIQTRKEYPLHDGSLADLLQALEANHPRAIGIDIARDVPQGAGRDSLIRQFQQHRHLIAACVLSSEQEPGVAPPPDIAPEQVAFADLPQDHDSIIRRSILVSTPSPSQVPAVNPNLCSEANSDNQLTSMSLSLALLYLENEGISPAPTANGGLQIGSTVFNPLSNSAGSYHNAGASDYQIMLNYHTPDAIRQVSLTDVLQGRIKPEWVRDRVVLVGYTSQVAKDTFYTPFSAGLDNDRAMPGVMIHAQSVSQILSAVLDHRPLIGYWPDLAEALWIAVWAILGGTIAWSVRKLWLFLSLEGVAIAVLFGFCGWLFLTGVWVPLVSSAIALVVAAFSVILVDRANQGGYTQAIYEQVRDQVQVALNPEIHIDQQKRQKEVAEITETSYFQELAERAKAIREQRDQKLRVLEQVDLSDGSASPSNQTDA
jgi:CHASE2 domain-containing sensor protein